VISTLDKDTLVAPVYYSKSLTLLLHCVQPDCQSTARLLNDNGLLRKIQQLPA
jgi:hypothetical protein